MSFHVWQVDALNLELTAHEEDLQQGSAAMNQWRTQWEEELTEKNSIDAELLTLRSEFEKSSATYDREIEGLKDMLERTRAANAEMRDRWEESVTRKNALLGQLEEKSKEIERAKTRQEGRR